MLDCRGRYRAWLGHTNMVVWLKRQKVSSGLWTFRLDGSCPWASQEKGLEAVGTVWAVSGWTESVDVPFELSALGGRGGVVEEWIWGLVGVFLYIYFFVTIAECVKFSSQGSNPALGANCTTAVATWDP